MERRQFIALLGGATAWPIAGQAQQPAPMPVIGYLSGATFEPMQEYVAAFHRGLADTGFVDGRNASSTGGQRVTMTGYLLWLSVLVRREVTIIVVGGSTPGALAD